MKDKELRAALTRGGILDDEKSFLFCYGFDRARDLAYRTSGRLDMLIDYLGLEVEPARPAGERIVKKKRAKKNG